ncbi:hypothetical protein [Paraliomyxa miuraensis]|uniref:hypothetical protein n=1 Tax=Paraliomyxa miuraensis TaxID=376150 RepID=UPI0022525404|nr:hypothetical protein [Paraliomyxa miuraensis]MCX4244231.1 hypothetical protein [Paraliomyxa miuraensis]
MLGSGWHRLPCGAAVRVDEVGQPLQVCDLGTATLEFDYGVFAGDQDFLDALADDLRDLGFEVVLDDWESASDALRSSLVLALGDDELEERAASAADVLRVEPTNASTPPTRVVPGLPGRADVEVDRYGAFVVERGADGRRRELPLREHGGVLEVELDGVTWCVDELVRRAWDDTLVELARVDEGRSLP